MEIYDKASWHIDEGEEEKKVIDIFQEIVKFLDDANMLSEEGKEALSLGVDYEFSLHSDMLTKQGKKFMDKWYDLAIENSEMKTVEYLERKLFG